ncbi:hypothetical protein BC629DRAFT_1538415 [Irpex lacteus]|nr:hypothetical protein BC629DRAFT_1538415 [Irpex lacteus]
MLLSLPDEMLVRILGELNASDRNARCRLVNHRLNSVIESSVVLQALTECELANLMLGTPRQDGLTGVLSSLEDRRNAWRTLQSMDELVLPALTEHEVIPILGRDCGIICQTNSNNELVFTRIPSRTKGIPYKTWTLDCGMNHVDDVAVDEQQDLLAVTGVLRDSTGCLNSLKVKFLSLSTGDTHTAADGVISLSLPPSYSTRDTSDSPAMNTALAGDFIGILLSILRDGQHDDVICYLWVFNWKTGEMKVEAWCGNDGQISNATSFAFLSPEYMLVARSNFSVQRVEHIIELIVVNTSGPPRRGTYATIADAIFGLPELEPGATCGHMAINAHGTPSNPPSHMDYMFTHTSESRMISIDLLYTGSRGLHYQYRLGVPATHMLRCLAEEKATHTSVGTSADNHAAFANEPQSLHIPWINWAREVRWVPIHNLWATASYSPTCWLLAESRSPYELQGHRSPIPGHTRSMEVLVKYDFPSEMQVRRENEVPRRPSVSSKGPLTLIEIQYNRREAVIADDLWASQVFSAPYRQTIFTTDVARDIRRDLCYEITEDALILQDGGEPRNPWRVFSI